MNRVIKDQLDMLKSLEFQVDGKPSKDFPETFSKVVFFKSNSKLDSLKDDNSLSIGKSYLIEFANYIINEPENFDLSKKWNNGIKPKSSIAKIKVLDIKGKMIKVNALGYDLKRNIEILDDLCSSLWVPMKAIRIIKVLD